MINIRTSYTFKMGCVCLSDVIRMLTQCTIVIIWEILNSYKRADMTEYRNQVECVVVTLYGSF